MCQPDRLSETDPYVAIHPSVSSSYCVGQQVEIMSESLGGWVLGRVEQTEPDGAVTVRYHSGESKRVPLAAQTTHMRPKGEGPSLAEMAAPVRSAPYFEQKADARTSDQMQMNYEPSAELYKYTAGERVMVYSQGSGQWVNAVVIGVGADSSVTVQYGDNMKRIPLESQDSHVKPADSEMAGMAGMMSQSTGMDGMSFQSTAWGMGTQSTAWGLGTQSTAWGMASVPGGAAGPWPLLKHRGRR